jgi:hypothetical protein
MKRRQLLQAAAAIPLLGADNVFAVDDPWGRSQGYPIGSRGPNGWRGGLNRETQYRVGNYSGGFEKGFPHHTIKAAQDKASAFTEMTTPFSYYWGGATRTPDDYLSEYPITGLLISRGDKILFEKYQFDRTREMRMTSWSMAKSVTSLLLGICLDLKLIDSYEDHADKYVSALKGQLHGGITLRNLSNMSSGSDFWADRDNRTIYPTAYERDDSSILKVVSNWNQKKEDQGISFNYNELCPLTIGLVIREVTGMSLSAFAEKVLWKPMGAEADATWTTDSKGQEFNCIGFAARLRDWARLGRLVAQRGASEDGKQVVSENWINECTHWGDQDRQCMSLPAHAYSGYKAHMWHNKRDGSRPSFNGFHSQRVIIDMPTQTVLVQTAVDNFGRGMSELNNLFETATKL